MIKVAAVSRKVNRMPLGSISPFRPTGTIGITATTTPANAALTGGGDTVVVTNPTTSLAYVRFGSDSTVAASTTDTPVLPNSRVMLALNTLITYGSAVLQSGTGTIFFSRGDGSVI
jgi:hypothetical protein